MGNNGISCFSFQEYATGCHICDKTPEQGKNLSQKGKKAVSVNGLGDYRSRVSILR